MKKSIAYTAARETASTAVMCALLIGVQFALSFVPGIELVTVTLACYASVCGVRRGVALAACFAVVRCLLFGFYPGVLVLYLVYYPTFAAVFGLLGHIKKETYERYPISLFVAVNATLIGIAGACAALLATGVAEIAAGSEIGVKALIITTFFVAAALCIAFDIMFAVGRPGGKNTSAAIRLTLYAATAAALAACFTLLDDVITPLMYGLTAEAALAYFYASFAAMIPQTLCAALSVAALYVPLETLMKRVTRR